eukprot:6180255-Pleurochrysis_carterae.AAC.1
MPSRPYTGTTRMALRGLPDVTYRRLYFELLTFVLMVVRSLRLEEPVTARSQHTQHGFNVHARAGVGVSKPRSPLAREILLARRVVALIVANLHAPAKEFARARTRVPIPYLHSCLYSTRLHSLGLGFGYNARLVRAADSAFRRQGGPQIDYPADSLTGGGSGGEGVEGRIEQGEFGGVDLVVSFGRVRRAWPDPKRERDVLARATSEVGGSDLQNGGSDLENGVNDL